MKLLKSTTAIALGMSLGLSGPVFPQSTDDGQAAEHAAQIATEMSLELCETAPGAPCVTDDAQILVPAEGLGELQLCGDDVAVPCVTEDGFAKVSPESDIAMSLMSMESSDSEDVAESEEASETESEETEMASENTEGEGGDGTEQLAESAEAEAETTEDAGETEDAPESTDAAEVTEANEGTIETEGVDSDGTEQLADGAEASEGTEAEMATETETTAETEGVESEAETESEAEIAEGETELEAEVEVETTAETEVTEVDESELEQSGETKTTVTDDGTVVAEVEEAASAAAAAADDGGDAEVAEVETEEVTEETARSADEEFEDTSQSASASGDDDGGLSNFEKALIVALGAVTVGSLLDNGDEVVSNSGDRVVLRDSDGTLRVLKDDDALLRRPGSTVQTETFNDGSTRTTVTREDGSKIVTIRAADGRVQRRVRFDAEGERFVLFDDTEEVAPVVVSELPESRPRTLDVDVTDEDALRAALAREEQRIIDRRFSLRQIRQIREVRFLAPEIELDAITFASGSAAIQPSQAEELSALGRTMLRLIEERPNEVFLIEGHTDAVGAASYNLALSDRRAETVALALTEYFDVPPENMVTQGYGEAQLKIRTLADERQNRRAVVRRITPLLQLAER